LRAGWITDIHLDLIEPEDRSHFYADLQRENLDLLLVGGDIGLANSVAQFLSEIAAAVEIPVYFVLGNHDYYGGSIADVRKQIREHCALHPWLRWLPETGIVELTPEIALVGHDCWADGRLGDGIRSEVMLTDYFAIDDLCDLSKEQRFAKLNALGDEAAEFLEPQVRQALELRREVLVLTHVPPFREACWHEGKTSRDEHLPHFGCKAVGDRLLTIMLENPSKQMTVLCGHTHGGGFAQILPNLSVRTGAADYELPRIQCVLELR
jgi:Icc-related predicted phosphoesterase